MFIWWQEIWDTDELRPFNVTNAPPQRNHIANSRPASNSPHHQLPYSVHHSNCSRSQSKCIRKTLTDHSSRMNSFCSVIILIHCFNVLVLAIASENLNSTQSLPCDRTRRVFTDIQGEISNGPPGYNYTQVSLPFAVFFISFRIHIYFCCCSRHYSVILLFNSFHNFVSVLY